jgi:hypothetical protein
MAILAGAREAQLGPALPGAPVLPGHSGFPGTAGLPGTGLPGTAGLPGVAVFSSVAGRREQSWPRDFLAAYPGYRRTTVLDELRQSEYGYLDAQAHVYLDYTAAGLAAEAQLSAHAARLRGRCFGNPHSENPASSASTRLIEQTRRAVLDHFNAPPAGSSARRTRSVLTAAWC